MRIPLAKIAVDEMNFLLRTLNYGVLFTRTRREAIVEDLGTTVLFCGKDGAY